MTPSHRLLKALAAFFLLFLPVAASAAESSLYLKSGWFTWDEHMNGASFVKEEGFLHAIGGTLTERFAKRFEVGGLVEVWGGNVDYDGHDVTGSADIKGSTSYVGTKEEVLVGVLLPLARSVEVKPFAGVGHRFWIRTRSSEDWNMFFARGGLGAQWRQPWGAFFVRGGGFFPFSIRNHVSLHDAGYEDVSVRPAGRVSPFAEGGVRGARWGLSVEYEELHLRESPKVVTRRLGVGTGAVVVNNLAFQPQSDSSLVSLKIFYLF